MEMAVTKVLETQKHSEQRTMIAQLKVTSFTLKCDYSLKNYNNE